MRIYKRLLIFTYILFVFVICFFLFSSYTLPIIKDEIPLPETILKEEIQKIYEYTIPSKYVNIIREENIYDLPEWFIARIITFESGWKEDCISINYDKKNRIVSYDVGLMQHNSNYCDDFKWRYNKGIDYNVFDPRDNIRIGLKHLSILYKALNGNLVKTAAAYNCGLGRVLRGGILPEKTYKYLEKIFMYKIKITYSEKEI